LKHTVISQFVEAPRAIVRLFRALASMLHQIVQTRDSRQAFDPALSVAESREEQAHEEALRQRYPNAMLQWNEMERRAAQHRVKFSAHAEAHHRAAILEFLDNPDLPTALTPMHATWFHAIGSDGQTTGSMAHPANRAQFQITYRWAARHNWSSDWYTAEHAQWSVQQWVDYERKERAAYAERPTGRTCILTHNGWRCH
jgi:hypothetical protein